MAKENVVEEYVVKLSADTEGLDKGFDDAQQFSKEIIASLKKSSDAWKKYQSQTSRMSKIDYAKAQRDSNARVMQQYQQMRNEMARVNSQFSGISKKLSTGARETAESYRAASKAVNDLVKQTEKASTATQEIKITRQDDYNSVDDGAADDLSSSANRLRDAVKPVTDEIKRDVEQINTEFSKIGDNVSVSADTQEIKEIPEDLSRATSNASMLRNMLRTLTFPNLRAHTGAFSEEADELRQKIADLKAQMEELGNTRVKTEDYEWVTNEIQKASDKLADYMARQDKMNALDVKQNSASWKSLQYDIDQAKAKLNDLIATRRAYEEMGNAYMPGTQTAEYSGMASQLSELQAALAQVEAQGSTVATSIAANIGGKLRSAIGSGVNAGVQIARAGLTNLGKVAKSVTKHFTGLRKETVSLRERLQGLGKSVQQFGRFALMWLQFAFISTVFEDMKANIDSLAKMSDRFNTAISGMISSCKTLGAQIVAAVDPLVSVAAPYVQAFIDKLTAAADTAAQFVARLTGNNTYIKASKGNYDYAASLDDTSTSAESATEAVKEYQNTVLGFDQLNKLNGVTGADGTGTADVDTGLTDPQLNRAETQATKLNSIADKIHDALTKGDFKAAGKAVGEAVNEAFSWLRNVAGWDKNAKKITKTVGNLIDFINGVATSFNGADAGTAIGDVVNSIIESLKMFTDPSAGIDFDLIGTRVGEMIKGAVDKIKWTDLGIAIVQGIQAAVRYVNGIVGVPGFWVSLGTAVKDGITGMVTAFDPAVWSTAVINLVNGFFTFLQTAFGNQEQFATLGTKLATTVNQIFSGISGEDIAAGINSFVNAILTTVNSFLSTLDWSTIISTLGDVLLNLDWLSLIQLVGVFAIPQIPGIIMPLLGNALSSIFSSIASVAGPMLSNAVTGLLTSLGSLLMAHPWAALIAGIATIIITAIVTHWDEIKEWWSGVWAKIQEIPGKIGEVAQNVWSAVTGWFSGIADFAGGVVDDVVGFFTSIPDKISGVFDTISGWISDAGSAIGSWFGGSTRTTSVIIPQLAGGGIVGDGQLFVANEKGPELVGSQDGQSVVMNNTQIVDAVSRGVRDAVAEVMMAFSGSGNSSSGGDGDIILMVDSEELARASMKGQRKLDKRSNATVSFA